MIWLDGGPSHYETFDPKPDAPSEIRGEFKAISTSVPGVQFCEAVPHLAKAADKLTINYINKHQSLKRDKLHDKRIAIVMHFEHFRSGAFFFIKLAKLSVGC